MINPLLQHAQVPVEEFSVIFPLTLVQSIILAVQFLSLKYWPSPNALHLFLLWQCSSSIIAKNDSNGCRYNDKLLPLAHNHFCDQTQRIILSIDLVYFSCQHNRYDTDFFVVRPIKLDLCEYARRRILGDLRVLGDLWHLRLLRQLLLLWDLRHMWV